MKQKILQYIMVMLTIYSITGCGTKNNDKLDTLDENKEGIQDTLKKEESNNEIEENNNVIENEQNQTSDDKTDINTSTNEKEENKTNSDKTNNTSTNKKEDNKTNNDKTNNTSTNKKEENQTNNDKTDNTSTNKKEENQTNNDDKVNNTSTNEKEEVSDNKEKDETSNKEDVSTEPEVKDENTEQTIELTSEQLKAKEIVDKIIKPSMSDFSKALAIHDWLTFNIDYDHSYSVYNVSDTLSKRVAVCSGYAQTFKMMAELAGLEAEYITGTANGEHAWNQVKINGVWYNVDVTWDDPTSKGKNPNDHSQNNYNYFLISDSTIRKDHIPDTTPHTCSKDYDRKTVIKSGVNNKYRSNTGFAETKSEANAFIKKMVEAGKNEFYIWYYNPSITPDNIKEKAHDLIDTSIYLVDIIYMIPINGVTVYKLKPIMPLSEWKNIPVVHNDEEFANIVNSNFDKSNENITLRYEPTNGNFEMVNLRYSIECSYRGYGTSYRLYTITKK